MKEYELLYQLKELEKNIVFFLTKDRCDSNVTPPTPTQIRIVDYIFKHGKDNVYQRDLEKELNLTRATLSGVLKTMEKNGIIKREINNTDARSKKIILNSKFEELFIKSQNKLAKAEYILTDNINNEELMTFKNVLNKMKNNIIKYNSKERND